MSVAAEIQSIAAAATIGFVVQLLIILTAAFKMGAWTSRVDAEREADREARGKEVQAAKEALEDLRENTSKAFAEIKATLGNGAPGTVVRTTVCEALHSGVEAKITAAHDDIRSLYTLVRDLFVKR